MTIKSYPPHADHPHLFSQYEKKTVANTVTETTLMGGGVGSLAWSANREY